LATASSYRVILDTNFLLAPFQFRVDIFAEIERILDVKYDLYVTDGVISELRGLMTMDAKGALSLVKELPRIATEGKDVDEALLALASKNTIMCTNDKILIEKLKSKGAPVIYLRQKNHLILDGYLR
jgi:rRNA-processing protein FCF1